MAPKAQDFWPLLCEFALSQRAWWVSLCEELDLTPMQGHALRVLDPDRPVSMNTLADSLICDASNVTGIVDRLEERGLVTRQASPKDRRLKMLVVTESGVVLRSQLLERLAEAPEPIQRLSESDQRRLRDILERAMDG
jgi:DNA-binding MarR family transcriptional regulator